MKELPIEAAMHLVSNYLTYFTNRGDKGDDTQYAAAVFGMFNEASDYLVKVGANRNEELFIYHAKILNSLNHFLNLQDSPLDSWTTLVERNNLPPEQMDEKISIDIACEATAQFIEYWLGNNEAAQYASAVNTTLGEVCEWFVQEGIRTSNSKIINYAVMLTTINSVLYGRGEQKPRVMWNNLLEKNGLPADNLILTDFMN